MWKNSSLFQFKSTAFHCKFRLYQSTICKMNSRMCGYSMWNDFGNSHFVADFPKRKKISGHYLWKLSEDWVGCLLDMPIMLNNLELFVITIKILSQNTHGIGSMVSGNVFIMLLTFHIHHAYCSCLVTMNLTEFNSNVTTGPDRRMRFVLAKCVLFLRLPFILATITFIHLIVR